MRLQAINNVIILEKDKSNLNGVEVKEMTQIPEPFTGWVDSIGFETDEYKIGEHIAFCDLGGAYIQMGDSEYVVITPDMIIGKIENNEYRGNEKTTE